MLSPSRLDPGRLQGKFSASYDSKKILAMCDPKSLAGALVAMSLLFVVPAYIPPLARHGSIDAHWVCFGVFACAVCCSYGFFRLRGAGRLAPVLTALDTLLAECALSIAVVTTTGHVRYAYAVLQGLVLIAAHSRYYSLTWAYAGVLAVPLLGIVGGAVAFFGIEGETLLVSVCMYLFALWVSNLTRMERAEAAKTAELREALFATDTVANRSFELALTRTALTMGDTLHELRNHLGVIGAGLEYMREAVGQESELKDALTDSIGGYRAARNVVEVTVGKLRQTRDQVDARFDATAVIGDFASSAGRSGVKVRAEGDSPPFIVRGDEDGFRTVLVNLTRNAAKAGARTVRLLRRVEDGGASLQIEIIDDGRGIDERVAADLFKPFVTAREAEGGTGLGLYLCRRQIELMGGTITVSSVAGGGTRFTVILPGSTGRVRSQHPSASDTAPASRADAG